MVKASSAMNLYRHVVVKDAGGNFDMQCRYLLKAHLKAELPRRSRNIYAPTTSVPLWGWLRGSARLLPYSPQYKGSRVLALDDPRTIWPYPAGFSDYSQEMADRLAKRLGLTYLQRSMLCDYAINFHRGRQGWLDSDSRHAGIYPNPIDGMEKAGTAGRDMMRAAIASLGIKYHQVPLRFLIDPALTNLILLRQLSFLLAPNRRKAAWNSKLTGSRPSEMCVA